MRHLKLKLWKKHFSNHSDYEVATLHNVTYVQYICYRSEKSLLQTKCMIDCFFSSTSFTFLSGEFFNINLWKSKPLERLTCPVLAALQRERTMGRFVWRWRSSVKASLKELAAATGSPSRQRHDELCAASKPINLRSTTTELLLWALSIST